MRACDSQNGEVDSLKGYDDFTVSLGDQLRGERATLGKSLEAAAQDLCIPSKYIAAIETSDLSVFKNPSTVAGYVRSYARYLNIDPEAAYEKFCEETGYQGVAAALGGVGPKGAANTANTGRTGLRASLSKPPKDSRFDNPTIPLRPLAVASIAEFSFIGLLSALLVCAMIAGLGYGGWYVIQEVQRVEFAPVEQEPGVASNIDDLANTTAPQGSPLQGEFTLAQAQSVDDLYRPKELELPSLLSRDGPIGAINPDTLNRFEPRQDPKPVLPEEVETAALPEAMTIERDPHVDILAVKPAWVRVSTPEGSILFEKILNTGERYRVPIDAASAQLRAGNSGSVYLMVDETVFGPVGKGTSVAKNVALQADVIQEVFAAQQSEVDIAIQAPVNADEISVTAVALPAQEN